MYALSVFHSQIYSSLLPGRLFPNLAGLSPAGLRPGRLEVGPGWANLLGALHRMLGEQGRRAAL
jgi:hypothetical protein